METQETKTIKLTQKTYDRLTKLGKKTDTYDSIISDLLGETEHINQIESLTRQAMYDFHASKADFKRSFPALTDAIMAFIASIKSR